MATPVIILATQRSGTNYLRSMLHNTGLFDNYDEVFHWPEKVEQHNFFLWKKEFLSEHKDYHIPSRENQERLFLNYLDYLSKQSDRKYVLVDIKYNSTGHFNTLWHSPSSKPFLFELIKMHKIKIIHLIRENVLATHISSRLADKNKIYTTKSGGNIPLKTIKLDKRYIIKNIERRIALINKLKKYLAGSDKLEVFYKNINDKNYIRKNIKAFLNIEMPLESNSDYKKINKSLWSNVENSDEIINYLLNTKYKNYLITS